MASTSAELPSGSSSSRLAATDLGGGRCVRIDRGPELGAGHGALRAGDTEPDQGADRGAQLGPLVVVEIGHAEHRDVVAVAHHEHGIDDPDLADVAQACQLLGDPTFEQVVVRKADHECLDGSDGHGGPPGFDGLPHAARPMVGDPTAARITQM